MHSTVLIDHVREYSFNNTRRKANRNPLEAIASVVYLNSVTAIPTNLTDAFSHCARITHDHYENFPVASWLMPKHIRPHICSIYAFARTADDFADEPGLDDVTRLLKLAEWETHLNNCLHAPTHPIFEALAETIRVFNIPMVLFFDLLSAFKQDVVQPRHPNFEDLLEYSRRSANPVGRLVLTLFGQTSWQQLEASDAICTALQLTNFWQDVGVDYSRGRVYLPGDEMARCGVSEEDLKRGHVNDCFRALMSEMVDRTRRLFEAGHTLPESVSGRLRYELRLTWLGGWTILNKIDAAGYNVFTKRPTVTRSRGCVLLLRSLSPIRIA